MRGVFLLGLFTVSLCVVSSIGCDAEYSLPTAATVQPLANANSVESEVDNNTLGQSQLVAGIPGEDKLTLQQVKKWLKTPGIHDPLEIRVPWHLRDAVVVIEPEQYLTRARVELGRQLFFDRRLSEALGFSCADCHNPGRAFAGYTADPHLDRDPMPIFNRLFSTSQFWDGRAARLSDQPKGPIENLHEMATTPAACAERIGQVKGYAVQFEAAYGRLDFEAVTFALAAFVRTLVTQPAPYDASVALRDESLPPNLRKHYTKILNQKPFSAAAARGEKLFFGKAECSNCHSGPNFTDEQFHNVGIRYSNQLDTDLGRYKVSNEDSDRGAFKTPTLRNVAITGPYMHNGRLDTLEKVIAWFSFGGGNDPLQSTAIHALDLNKNEQLDLVAFLESLTGLPPTVCQARLLE
jgi:cytochrome c peroxidase